MRDCFYCWSKRGLGRSFLVGTIFCSNFNFGLSDKNLLGFFLFFTLFNIIPFWQLICHSIIVPILSEPKSTASKCHQWGDRSSPPKFHYWCNKSSRPAICRLSRGEAKGFSARRTQSEADTTPFSYRFPNNERIPTPLYFIIN
jgi:hypothetical protein